ncbi:MAG TPA: AAA family ATPase [Ktedonobacteraceae bacterium]|jgi:ABC-type lipoprotein export system ATPase subunit|nr:AAA family ATPase [Ktedonobacteraceae bacterium]
MSNLILPSLEISRFRAFEHLQIDHLNRVNLIVGKNNVGKTSLLEAIQLYARNGSPKFILELLEARDEKQVANLNNLSAIDFQDILPGLKYIFFGRKEITNLLETVRIGPVNDPNKTLTLTIGGFDFLNTVDDQGPRLSIHLGQQQLVNFSIHSSTYPRLPLTELKGIPCISISSNGLSRRLIGGLWDNIALTSLEQEIRAALQLIAPGTEAIGFVGDPLSGSGRIPIVKINNIEEPLPLRSLGDGMQRLFGIVLALVNARNGLLLIDEFENGLYYTVQPDVWRLIFQLARRLNTQVFATTHSWDCIEAFQKAAQEDTQDGALLIRLENIKGKIVPTLFDERKLGIATRDHIEVR